ncbi:aminoglycoside phosphotransferase family protein [Streptomyces sp. NPDC086776]|uniref:aminoglycoside phosphotransferase family protein n=1 Tax=Streptomyces sp. NPDC086776 TaxID=3365756 RepID=UPI0038021C76
MDHDTPDFMAMFDAAMRPGSDARGYYHRNVQVTADGYSYMVRVPMEESEVMDLSIWPEHEILSALPPYFAHAPRLLYVHHDPYFQIQEFIEGDRVEDLHPHGESVPVRIVDEIVTLFAELLSFPESRIPPLPADWPADGDSNGFGSALLQLGRSLREGHGKEAPGLFERLGIPEDPFLQLEDGLTALAVRPFRLLHGDIHRGNMIKGARETFFLDWQLALWGDPVYDLADHVHKMGYTPDDKQRFIRGWLAVAPDNCKRRWSEDLTFYLAYERVKSSVVDTVRWSRRIAEAPTGSPAWRAAVHELTAKINQAQRYWSQGRSGALAADRVASAVMEFHQT